MSVDKSASWSFTESLPVEDEVLLAARSRAADLGVAAVPASVASLLTVLAASRGAQTAVEVGSGAGISTLALLRGMKPTGVLTAIDKDLDHLKATRVALAEDGIVGNRLRPITGKAAEVLPRLTKDAYDIVFLDADKPNYADYVDHGLRLLRAGGLLIINDALDEHQVSQPTSRKPSTQIMRAIIKKLSQEEGVRSTLLPVGTGLIVAVKN
ncbi:O-methyltransferase [Haematomicrobium sanguinis]|uniref:O-methyltransferase n=1 Tax=Haematomicrobium sanguinis TaxID=479106 RepID=UPI00047B7ED9|nr:class I SAM-dependent methyltransferase [Haematomicrobium sanguinis]